MQVSLQQIIDRNDPMALVLQNVWSVALVVSCRDLTAILRKLARFYAAWITVEQIE